MGGKGPPRPSSSESDDWGDESWIVDCPCGVNYDDGEEMVECDECGVWVHTACCRVAKGLPTFVCDKCKTNKKLKESEESEVAQLLADLPSKSVSFEQERTHQEKPETYITGHQNSSEIPIEERVHVHGIPGGEPSFFVGAPAVCCRELWKYSGYVPKLLKLEYKELPEPREDVAELLRDLKHSAEFDVLMDDDRKSLPLVVESLHATVAPMVVDTILSQEELLSKEEVQATEATPNDRQRKSLQARKGEGKVSKNRHKPRVKDGKPQLNGKRVRNEGGLKEQSSKKKPRTNGDVFKPEDGGDSKKLAGAPAQETAALKSPLSSPKNPKAMKKLAVQEFMDGDVILCSVCGKVEPLLDPTTGGSTVAGSDSLCQECEEVRRLSSPVSPKQEEARSVKQEAAVLSVPSVVNSDGTLEVKAVSKRELDCCEAGTEAVRSRAEASSDGIRQEILSKSKVCNDSPTDTKKVNLDVTNLHKSTGMHENLKGTDDKRRPSVKIEPIGSTVNHLSVDTKTMKFPDALELPAVRTIVAAKSSGESAARAEDLRQDGAHVVASRPSSADDAETRTAGDYSDAVCGNKQAVSVEGPVPVSSSDNLSTIVQLLPVSSTLPVVHGGAVPAEAENGNGSSVTIPQDRVMPPVVAETMEDRASKLSTLTVITETRSQGSARTAGHLPASVRGKMHGDRCNPHLQRLSSGAQQQVSSQAGQSLASGNSKAVHKPVATSLKGSYGDDTASGKQNIQAQQDCTSPAQQSSKQGQHSRLHTAPTTPAQKSPAGLPETSSPSQPSSIQRIDDQQPSTKPGVLEHSRNESSLQASSPKESKIATGSNSEAQVSKPTPSAQVTPVICQQARQLNGIGHVYVSRKHREFHISKDAAGTVTSQGGNSSLSNTKISVSSLKSPSSGTSSSSPTSPLVTTPSSKPQPSVKVPELLPSQKSLSGGLTPNASAPYSSSKLSGSLTANVSSIKQVGTLHSSKSSPSLPASPQSAKVASMSKQSSRSSSMQATKPGDGSNSMPKATTGIMSSRGLNHSGSSSSVSAKEILKNSAHTSSKSALKASEKPAGAKPPSSGKSSHSVAATKGSSLAKQHSGPGSSSLKVSSTPSSVKHVSSHHSKSMSHKDEKSSMPSAPPVPKAMSSMPPPPPQVSTKRSPPTVLASSVATTLKDEELALLLHQELNSSPRVPRVPRVRQGGVSLQLVSPSLSSGKGSFASTGSGGLSYKDHQLAQRKRTREDRLKDTSREDGTKSGGKRSDENKMDDEKLSTEKTGRNGSMDGFSTKEKSGSVEGNSRHHGFAKGNLSIIVPGSDEGQEGDKKSPAQSNVVTLPGLIDEVLSSGNHQLSYDDVCEAVLPHWSKLRKPNGDRYAYSSHRLAVLDCLRNRPAWAHLVGRGPKTNPGRKRRRNEIKSLSDSDEEDGQLGFRDSDQLDAGNSVKRRKESGDKRGGEALEDAHRRGRQVRRRRRVEIEDGTDGEDEPVNVTKKASSGKPKVSKSDDGTSQEEEPEAESSPSSEEEASNYSTDDEEMVVHRGIRNRRRPTDESSSSEDDID